MRLVEKQIKYRIQKEQIIMIKKMQIIVVCLMLTLLAHAQDYTYDRQIGEQSAKQVEMMIGLYPDSTLNAYVDEVGERLVVALGKSPFQFEFNVVDMAEPNAFALPGGFIYVSRGLLSLVNEEDELAGVIGHEMIHVTKRHSIKQMKKSILPSILMIPGALVGGLVNEDLGNIINAPISLGSNLFLMNYSRKQEKEADLYGVELASEAGYDPSKLAVILHHLSKEVENLTGEAEKKSYFSSHPFTPKRVEDLGEHVHSITWRSATPIAENKSILFSKLDGMYIGQNPSQGIFKDNLFLHPELNLSLQFPKDWKTVNVPAAVGAFEEKGNAQIIVTLEDQFSTADSAANVFAQKFKEWSGKDPYINDSVEINGYKSRRISVTEKQNEKVIALNSWWIQKEQYLLNIVAVSLVEFEEPVMEAVTSLKDLTEEEKQMITGLKLKSAVAQKGETISQFCERTGNALDAKETALVNGLEENSKLDEGQVLKIAIDTPYFN